MSSMEQSHFPYEEIVNLPHHVSFSHPAMSMHDRAAQFSPFAALTGYDDAIDETARLTETKRELSAEDLEKLNRQIKYLSEHIKEQPLVAVEYFVPDERKEGGSYKKKSGRLRRIDQVMREMEFTDRVKISFDDVLYCEQEERGSS